MKDPIAAKEAQAQRDRFERTIQTYSHWRHYKGGTYTVLAIACVEDDPSKVVVIYENDDDGYIWSRPVDVWLETVDGKPRFERIG